MNNSALDNYCIAKNITNVAECYFYFASNRVAQCVFEILLGFFVGLSNSFAVFQLIRKKVKVCFDYIFIWCCIADFSNGVISLPFFHIKTVVDYWPFSKEFCIIWNTFDCMMNTINIFQVLFLSWCRRISITHPKDYQSNILVRNANFFCASVWILSVLIWLPINITYFLRYYQYGVCLIEYNPNYIRLLIMLVTWFIPLTIIIIFTINIIVLLNIKKMKKVAPTKALKRGVFIVNEASTLGTTFSSTNESEIRSLSTQSNKISKLVYFRTNFYKLVNRIDPQTKLSIIIIIYLTQWFPSCILSMANSICNSCISVNLELAIYWTTFTVSLTNPVSLLVLSPNFIHK